MRRLLTVWVAGVCSGLLAAGCAAGGASAGTNDLPAFRQVDEGYYRGGQPSPEGIQQLARMGVRTIINLRHHTAQMDQERQRAEQLEMQWVNLPLWYFWHPSDQHIQQFLALVTDPAHRPVFVHCRQGRNRAGIMTAIYRVAYHGWTPKRAYAEGRTYGLVPWNVFTHWLLIRHASGILASAPAS